MLNTIKAAGRLRERSAVSDVLSFEGSACVLWTGRVDRDGYPGKLQVDGIVTAAHRMAYWVAAGPIPAGLQIDHRCHDPRTCRDSSACPHRRCINPLHLEAVTPWENTMRSGGVAAANARRRTCSRGHEWDKVHASGRRRCSTCEQELARERYERRSEHERGRSNLRRRELDAGADRRRRKNRAALLAKRGLKPAECLNGHPYIAGSFRISESGKRICLTCWRDRSISRAARAAPAPGRRPAGPTGDG